ATYRSERAGKRPSKLGRRIAMAVGLVLLAGVVYYGVTLAQVWSTGRADDRDPVDAIVVMGAAQYDGRPSPQLAARLDHVVEIWPDEVAPLVVVTGGKLPADRFTEAEASATYLVDRGIPESAVLLENGGSDSYESLAAVSEMLGERGLNSVVIVTDPYHALRSELIADEVGLDASVSSTDTSVVTGSESVFRHLKEAAGVAVGRIIGFDRLAELSD
ncbi:YdcF family protein, partial [Ilumatobacter sp.]|uniref:YdcF family protein n=1 Tax=Ilumatobacter sp. TaxID=1967498 RepID=UPI003C55E3C5